MMKNTSAMSRIFSGTFFCYSTSSDALCQKKQWQVPSGGSASWYPNTTLENGIKSPVFHQFNIPNISRSQADSNRSPTKTYGIQLKGSSFSKTVSFSLNFLRRSVWTCFRFLKKKVVEVLQHWKKVWIQPGHCHLSTSVLFKGVFALKNVCEPSSSLPANFISSI